MRRSKAYCLLRDKPFYRRDAFLQGLTLAGYEARSGAPWYPVGPGDVLVTWNRYGEHEQQADRFEAQGGTVLVAENGYLGIGGTTPKEDVCGPYNGSHYYALSRHAHNGRGGWPAGDGSRFAALHVTPAPWRSGGDYILVCANRSFGMRGGIMPRGWGATVRDLLAKLTRMPIRVREHPGNDRSPRSLAADLAGAAVVYIWSSSCGVHALLAGIPVVCFSPWWICKSAAGEGLGALVRSNFLRQSALERLAWAQWTVDEIASGLPFELLCGTSTAPATSTAPQ